MHPIKVPALVWSRPRPLEGRGRNAKALRPNHFAGHVITRLLVRILKLTADFTMTRISIVVQLLDDNFLICVNHNQRHGCCQLGVYIPLLEFAQFPWWEDHLNKQTNHCVCLLSDANKNCTVSDLRSSLTYHSKSLTWVFREAVILFLCIFWCCFVSYVNVFVKWVDDGSIFLYSFENLVLHC